MTTQKKTIFLVGIGMGTTPTITHQAALLLASAPTIYSPVCDAPVFYDVAINSTFIPLTNMSDVQTIANQLIVAAKKDGYVWCALPGTPTDHSLTTTLQNMHAGVTINITSGISIFDVCCNTLSLNRMADGLQLVPATVLLQTIAPDPQEASRDIITEKPDESWCEMNNIAPYEPPCTPYPLLTSQPALLWLSSMQDVAQTATIKEQLQQRYPSNHCITRVTFTNHGFPHIPQKFTLNDLPCSADVTLPCVYYIPPILPLHNVRSVEGLMWVTARLLGRGGCLWDRQQQFHDMRRSVLEEAYEVIEALDQNDMVLLCEELGDLLLQVFVQSEMARQAQLFTFEDVVRHITTKLIRRHPHVFGSIVVDSTNEILHNWETIKQQELTEKGQARQSALDGIPAGLPALAMAQKILYKATRTGFDWDTVDGVWDKLHEELHELIEACNEHNTTASPTTQAHIAEELGDVLLTLTLLAHWLNVDAESALREAVNKFRFRYTYIEQRATDGGMGISTLTDAEKMALWQEAKAAQAAPA